MTRTRDVTGIIFDIDDMKARKCMVTVRVTSDKDFGKSLSLNAYNIMIEIPLEPVSDYIEVVNG